MWASDWMCVSSRESSRMSQLPTLLLTESWLLYFFFYFLRRTSSQSECWDYRPSINDKKIIFWPMLMIVRGWLTLDRTIYFSRHTNYMSPSFLSPFISIQMKKWGIWRDCVSLSTGLAIICPVSPYPVFLTLSKGKIMKNNYSTVLQKRNMMKTKGVMFSTCGEIVCRWW